MPSKRPTPASFPSKLKHPAKQALANGPHLETAATESGELVTRVRPSSSSSSSSTLQVPNRGDVIVDAHTSTANGKSEATPCGRMRANSFKARPSLMDWETMQYTQNSFRGFFTLFWMTMAAYMALNLFNHWKSKGQFIGTRLFREMFYESSEFLLSELLLILSLFTIFLWQKLLTHLAPLFLTHRHLSPRAICLTFQHTYQLTWFLTCILWAMRAPWSWPQTGMFTLHAMAMLMKQHSYLAYNREMLGKWVQVQRRTIRMDELAARMKTLDDTTDAAELTVCNIEWETCKRQATELQIELRKGTTAFPENVTLPNFIDYLLVPTLVYELEYPRTDRIRIAYLLEKTAGFLGIAVCLYIVIEHLIYPVLANLRNLSFAESITQLLIPFMVCYMMIFYIIFECICPWFAELTRFADRHFYSDWWNSLTFDDYARKWNKPVHEFLLRHVYLESIATYKLSRRSATFLTFFLSSCLHELLMIVLSGRVRCYLFGMQMMQIPLVVVSRWAGFRRWPRAGNAFFWGAMYLGPPLLGIAYCREMLAR
ncbi:MBOAT, membrane-bound O-acyltransferase family-domain-containing protein [Fimicolochytrium jonesii]|uniref:MBOAT, membrane-bound O-acyltransferase family-domain-containing protein n=1 Tax=Fimicolochytrium jonesii TaxID=1396493 RepID=UPI0022FE7179|nr:MBOAT, membrane-bound O-acyltransferase family-domain-containing protein [Fimicolochytrium jonesii]KAI8816983.1 MBOAT, membrane-bound O-acyltransferase family-domain-containing protein [Fimicolochytrium jonesii]